MAFIGILPSSARRDTIIITSIICLVTVILTFRSIFSDRSPSPNLPKFGNAKPTPIHDTKPPSQAKPTVVISSTTSVTLQSTTSTSITPTSTTESENTQHIAEGCESFPDTRDILLVMKTGATEAYDKLPIHFLTSLKCVNDTILFSDMEMDMAGHHLIDVLDEVTDDVKDGNKDFDLYRKLQEYHRLREDPRALKDGQAGWNLDKYKFTQMLLKSYKYRPDAPWYVFIEADTTLIWNNLRRFLDTMDPKKRIYMGSPTYISNLEFAHGGTGYVISQAAMEVAVGGHPELAEKYDKTVKDICCGDAMIGRVLLDEDIHLTRVWPLLNGEKPNTLMFAHNHWCQPVLSMHHLTAEEVAMVWNFEQERKNKGIKDPMLFRDLYLRFVDAALEPQRTDWMNLAQDKTYIADPTADFNGRKWDDLNEVERSANVSPDACQKVCEEDKECIIWVHHDRECKTDKGVKLGGSKRPEGGKAWVSGWNMERWGKVKADLGDCADGPDWKFRGP